MSKSTFIDGSVFEFKLRNGCGFGYCKILDFRHIRKFDGVLAKVYDCIVKETLTDIQILNKKDWLFGARRLDAIPNSRGKGAWKLKGVLVGRDDQVIPDFKYSHQSSLLMEDESKIDKWFALKNISNSTPCSYDQVKHLENTIVGTQLGIEIRTTMEYYRINKLDIKKDFDLEDMSNWSNYLSMINIPIYSTIPKGSRGKALC